MSSSNTEDPLKVGTPDGNLKVNNKGILQLSEYQGSATAVIGGILYSGSNLFIGD